METKKIIVTILAVIITITMALASGAHLKKYPYDRNYDYRALNQLAAYYTVQG